ncbi:FtsX-like permease family protein [Histidinibacterium aquaticum]|uniref:FtsX-like permease family protein n=1 Tax=Histidinibacterium aquaticum TaxID=2613962 RepID=A0A5J5GCQ7_9RHOB|nr:FtsX-like permease family protein [Histidinibacterium aquaticum]KAA9005959.1 FtsX-like permease family protein [Histidinibacterium aquaticum]
MRDLWLDLSATTQDAILLVALLLPGAILAALLLRGFAPGPLVRALLWRFRWANAVFALLIAISVGSGLALIAQERGLRQGTAQAADKFDMVVSAPGSELTMMLAAVFLQATDAPLLDGETYQEIATHPRVKIAAPLAFGDSYERAPVVGTIADFVTYLSDGEIEGRMWTSTFEAVAGANAPAGIGDSFVPAHGHGDSAEEGAHGDAFTVVGRLPPTGSPWDNAILIPVEAVWAVHGLADGHAPDAESRLGPPFDARYFPGTPAVVVRAESLGATYALRSEFTRDAETMAFFPGAVLSDLYRIMGDVRQAMSALTLVTQALVAISVLLGLFILSRLFRRQLALLRALGAPPRFIMAVIWSYAAALLAAGTALGIGLGYLTAAVLSRVVTARTDILVQASLGWTEMHLAAGFLSAMLVLSLVPAWSVLRAPVLSGLRS